ncbi:MAG: tyrosine-protein kinase [Thermoleophilaceae bacterium]|nr:tyrosine-protein kinase [Thermoleophilaceae bacterium]
MASTESSSTYGLESPTREHVSLLGVLRRRALIIVVVTLLAGGAAAAFAYATRDSYESTAKLLFSQTIGPELNALGLLPGTPDADNLAQNNVQVVDSRRVAVETARELQARGQDISVDDVDEDVTVTSARDTDVVQVLAKGKSAERAAGLATAYARNAAEQADADQRAQAQRALDNVRQQLAELPVEQQTGTEGRRLRENTERLRTLAEVGTGSPRVIQRGYLPSSESGNPIQTIALGVLFGVLLGVGLALVREQSDRKLRRTEQVTAAFDAPVLTTVPRSRALKRHKPFADLPPQVAEAFRMLQMNLRFARDEPVRSVLVTSSRSREGKTTVAWNLAAAAASGGLSVALVEADLRRPSLAKRYDLEEGPGLVEALKGEISISAAMQTILPIPGSANPIGHPRPLHVIVAGQPAPNPWALMQSSVMARVLDVLRKDHDLVVIDTPPLPHVADAISLLRHVDGVLVTASINSTRGPEASRLRDQLQALEANVLGVVANGGSAMSGYAAYARATAATTAANGGGGDGDGHPGTPMEVRDPTDQPTRTL